MASIVDPTLSRNGAGTVTRNLVRALESPDLGATVECVASGPSSTIMHRLRQGVAIARSLTSSLPAKAAYTYTRRFRDRVLDRVHRGRFDLVILNGSDLLWLDPLLPAGLPRLLIAHNIEHLLLESQAAIVERSFQPLRPVLARECRRMKRFETSGIRSVGNVLFLSSYDASHPRAGALATRALVVPPIFSDPPCARPQLASGRLEIGFLGHMGWWPNRRGLSWFLSDVFPHLGPEIHLHLFGPRTERHARGNSRVSRHGAVNDVAEVWRCCHLMICPTRTGGGVCTKLAEAVYHGTPVLATTLATRGLPLADDPCITVSDDAAAWIGYLNSATVRAAAASRVSPSVSRGFAVETHRSALHQFIADVVADVPPRGPSTASV